MRFAPKDLARALYLATRQEPERKAGAFVKNLVEVARHRGLERSLKDVLDALPAVMEEIDAENRVTIETAREIDDDRAAEALKAAGISTENVDVVRKVDPALLGGIRIRTKDALVDATARGIIEALDRAFKRPATND